MNEQQTNIENLLIEYYEGKLNGAPHDEVKAWIAASEENRRMARRIYSLLLAADVHQVRKEIDTEKALKIVKGRKIALKRTISWWEWGQRAAAILILPLIGVLIWQQSRMQQLASPVAEVREVHTNPGMTTRLNLPDGTQVCLNAGSTLTYPAQFTGNTRSVHLSGEAYFEVAKDPDNRFIVHTPDRSAIEVHGTHFNVEAYPEDANVTTTLTEGKVSFLYQEGGAMKRVSMIPGQKLTYNASNHGLALQKTSGVAELSWTEGKIIFENTPLSEALHMLSKRFHATFKVRDARLEANRFTGTFTTQQLEKILRYFEISSNIHWRYLNDPDLRQEKLQIEIY